MTKRNPDLPAARGGVAVICFLIIILGQAYLLRNILFTGNFTSLPAPYYAEFFFCILLAAGTVICFIRPQGWGGKVGCGIALVLFVLYTVVSIAFYDIFAAGYLTGFSAQYDSAGGALVAFKLVLALIGITAGIPVAPRIDDREYARRLREKVQQQDAQWAKASVHGAQKDLEATLDKLKATLSEEEMAALLVRLQETADKSAEVPDTDAEQKSTAEDWHGWGGGM